YQASPARPLSAAFGGSAPGTGSAGRGSLGVLLSGGPAAAVSGPRAPWRALPALPAGASPRSAGGATLAAAPGGFEALTARGSQLSVWALPAGSSGWDRSQVINVAIPYGSSPRGWGTSELPRPSLVLRPVPDRGGGPGGLARDRAGPAGPAVPARADPPAQTPFALVLRRSRRAARRGRITPGLLGRRLLLRAHAPAPAAHVRRAHAGRSRGPLAATARWAARADGPDRDRRGAAEPLVAPASRHRGLPAAALGLGGPVLRRDAGLA